MPRLRIAPYENQDENLAAASAHFPPRKESSRLTPNPSAPPRKPWYSILYIQVLIAIFISILIGHFSPKTGLALKPLGDAFVALIRNDDPSRDLLRRRP